MADAPKIRWLHLSMWTLFLVAIVSVWWLGWNLNVIRQRRNLLELVINSGGMYETATGYSPTGWHRSPAVSNPTPKLMETLNPKFKQFSVVRTWLGDEPILVIDFGPKMTPAQREEIRSAFSEAIIQ